MMLIVWHFVEDKQMIGFRDCCSQLISQILAGFPLPILQRVVYKNRMNQLPRGVSPISQPRIYIEMERESLESVIETDKYTSCR